MFLYKFTTFSYRTTSQFSSVRIGSKLTTSAFYDSVKEFLPIPEIHDTFNKIEQCAEFICLPIPPGGDGRNFICQLPKCPDTYEVELDNSDTKPGECQKYSCVLRSIRDNVCEISGKSITTFDGTEFKYETCSHILARDVAKLQWIVSSISYTYLCIALA